MGKVESATGWQANMRYSCNSLYLGQAENYLNVKSCFEIEHGTQRYPNRIEDPAPFLGDALTCTILGVCPNAEYP